MKLTGIILAGGQSKRMGSDKGLMVFKGKPLVRHALDLAMSVCDDIILSANSPEYQKFGFPVVEDNVKGIGPAGGILTALKASKTDHSLIISCDMPFLNTEAAELLIGSVRKSANCIPVHKNGIEPLFGIYHKNFIPVIEQEIADNIYKLKTLLDHYDTHYLDFNRMIEKYPILFKNLNYLSDLINI